MLKIKLFLVPIIVVIFVILCFLNYIYPSFTNFFFQFVIAVGTLGVFIFSLFRKSIDSFFYYPELKIFVKLEAPYAHIVQTTNNELKQAWFSIGIINKSKTSAKNVQVFFVPLASSNSNIIGFKWIQLNKPYNKEYLIQKKLVKGVPSRWDLFHIDNYKINDKGKIIDKNKSPLSFDLSAIPPEMRNLEKLELKFRIVVTCDNSNKIFSKDFRIKYEGSWSDSVGFILDKYEPINF